MRQFNTQTDDLSQQQDPCRNKTKKKTYTILLIPDKGCIFATKKA